MSLDGLKAIMAKLIPGAVPAKKETTGTVADNNKSGPNAFGDKIVGDPDAGTKLERTTPPEPGSEEDTNSLMDQLARDAESKPKKSLIREEERRPKQPE